MRRIIFKHCHTIATRFRCISNLLKSVVLFCTLSLSGPLLTTAKAEFVKTGSVYQTERTRAIAVSNNGISGVFIVSGPAVPIQTFDLPTYTAQGALSVFIKASQGTQNFTELVTTSGTYKITGSFSIMMGATRVTVDLLSGPVAYLSIADLSSEPRSLLGFSGLTPVINVSGDTAATLLEANIPTQSGKIEPYVLEANGSISVAGSKLTSGRIGVLSEIANSCREGSALVLDVEESAPIIKAIAGDGALDADWIREQATKKGSDRGKSLRDIIVLKVSGDSLVGFNPATGGFTVVRSHELSMPVHGVSTLCLMSVVKIDD